jgi:hypothetical protein
MHILTFLKESMATKKLKIALTLIKNLFFIGCLFIRLFMLFTFFLKFFQLIHGFHLHVFSIQLSHYYWNIKLNPFFKHFFYSNTIGLTSNVLWMQSSLMQLISSTNILNNTWHTLLTDNTFIIQVFDKLSTL